MSKEAQVKQLTDYMAKFIAYTAKKLPDDVIAKLQELRDKEDSPLSKTIYNTMFENQKLAVELNRPSCLDTGVGFFDHMLDGFTRHGLFDLDIKVKGDLQVDDHHTIEDTGIVLGTAIKEAVGDKKGIRRYGSCILPMDECLVLCAIDLGGRPYLSFEGAFTSEKIGDMSTEMVKEFFYAISYTAAMNLHIKVLTPGNNHHMAEAMFKSFAKALDMAVAYDPRITDVLSTKGSL